MFKRFVKVLNVVLFVSFILPVMAMNVATAATLEKVRIGQIPERTRVVFELNKQTAYDIQQLSNPSRIIIDFAHTHPELEFSTYTLQRDKRLFQTVVQRRPQSTRVTLKLHKHQSYKYFTLKPKGKKAHRLVLDLIDPVPNTPALKKAPIASKAKPIIANHADKTVKKQLEKLNTPEDDRFVIVLDAGHGGNDSGAVGHNKVLEKDATLAIAQALKNSLKGNQKYKIVMTREQDKYVSLERRAEIAMQHHADLFISIHADSFHDHKVDGASIYVLNEAGASSEMAAKLAQIENDYVTKSKAPKLDKEVMIAINDLTRAANLRTSKQIAKSVLKHLADVNSLHKQSVQSANFAVLRTVGVPAILIETAFISNPKEAKRLMNHKFQQQVADSIAMGVNDFITAQKSPASRSEGLTYQYKVKAGDNLSMIAERFKVPLSKLLKANQLKKRNHLRIGQLLTIPLTEQFVESVNVLHLSRL